MSRRAPPEEGLDYQIHCALRMTFGDMAPQPFLVQIDGRDGVRLQGYGPVDAPMLCQQQAIFADPLLMAAFPPDEILSKPMPLESFVAGMALGFSVRICPIVRQERETGGHREVDAFVAASQRRDAAETLTPEGVYGDWLRRQMEREGAVRVISLEMAPMHRVQSSRRTRGADARPTGWGKVETPDVRFSGVCEVVEPTAFAALLTRGVGRHRAFGFGMVLLRPVPLAR